MNAVSRQGFLLAIAGLSLTACASGPEREWYKPGGSYTVADWERDEAACRKNRAVDEECLKERGWIPLSIEEKKRAAPQPTGPRGGRSY